MTGINLHLDDSMGAFTLGVILSAILFGCTCGQAAFYYSTYQADAVATKILVTIVLTLDFTKNALNVEILWHYLVQAHGDPAALEHLTVPFALNVALTSLMALLVRLCFTRHIWYLRSTSWYHFPVTIVATLFSLTSFGCSLAICYRLIRGNTHISQVLQSNKAGIIVYALASFLSDLYIAVSLCLVLHKARTGHQRTESVISLLISYTIQRGVLLSIMQTGLLASSIYCVIYGTEIVMIFFFGTSTLAANTLLASLNVRRHVAVVSKPHYGASSRSHTLPIELSG